jgi:beta-glucosidase
VKSDDFRSRAHAARVAAVLALCFALNAAPAGQPDLWPQGTHRADGRSDTEVFVNQLLASMTLEEKVGQMIQADIGSITPAQLHTYKLGSILSGGGGAPGNDVRTTPQAWLDLTTAYFNASVANDNPSHQAIPIIFGIDAVHGNAKIVGATVFPHNIALGAAHDPGLVRRIGEATAQEVSSIGVDWTFAPTVAVVRDVRWGRSYESYSENPDLVAQYAAAMVTGLQGEWGTPDFMAPPHTLVSVKHFLGDGGTTGGRDQGNNESSEALLSQVHGAAYPAAIQAGALIVMASYNSWHGVKMHASHYLLTDILKGRMAFDGFIVGDWNAQEQIPGCTKFSCPAAYLAGVDMLMAPDSWKELYDNTLAQVRSGVIPQSRVDDAVRRILRVKTLAGIFLRATPSQRSDAGHFEVLGSAEHRALARKAVRKSLVLLKNEHGTLPLKPSSHVLVAGEAADDIGIQAGGWTIDWQGDHNTNADFPGGTSIFAGIRAAVTAAGGSATFSRDGQFSQRPDVAIVVFGERPYAEFEGDRETLAYSPGDPHDLQMLRRLHSQHIPVVAVFLSGRPLWVNPELNASDAFVAAWLPGSEGAGIADVLFRAADGTVPYDFTGRLGFSWPQTAMPVTFDATGRVSGALFARGFGLDYGHAAHLPHLDEQAHVPADRTITGTLYHAAHVTAPWSIYLSDASAEVRLTTAQQTSPQGAVTVSQTPARATAAWNGPQRSMVRIAGRQADFRTPAARGEQIEMHFRVDRAPTGRVQVGVRCTEAYTSHPAEAPAAGGSPPDAALCAQPGGAMVDLTRAFHDAPAGKWTTLSYSFSCFSAHDADLSNVAAPAGAGAYHCSTAPVTAMSIRALTSAIPKPWTICWPRSEKSRWPTRACCASSPDGAGYSGIATWWRWGWRRDFWSRWRAPAFTWS